MKLLAEALKAEFTAISYFLHCKVRDNWGYYRLGAHYRQESIQGSIDETVHAGKLMDRIIFLHAPHE